MSLESTDSMIHKIYKLSASPDGQKIQQRIMYDIALGFVVIAPSEQDARDLLERSFHKGEECTHYKEGRADFWSNSKLSVCEEIGISQDNSTSIVLVSFNSG